MIVPDEDVARLLHDATRGVTAPPRLLEQVRHGATRRLRRRRRGAVLASAALAGLVAAGTLTLVPGGTSAAPPAAPAVAPGPTPSRSVVPPALLQTVAPSRVFTASGLFGDGTTLQRHPSALTVTKTVTSEYGEDDAQAVLVVFPLARVAPACVQQAALELDVTATNGAPAEIGVYPGAARSLVEGRLPPGGEGSVTVLVDNRPRGLVRLTGSGRVQVDVTALYRVWATGGPFPSTSRTLPPGTPLLLVLRPTSADDGVWTVALGAAPTLTYLSTPGCR